ncbi:MAG: rhodanese-like domain-containing protein [Chitinophagaceae bacterium]|nr:rhodanese-like domain-containing protein [Chitinophagaceae bacterium]
MIQLLDRLLNHTVNEITVNTAAHLKHPFFIDTREVEEYTISHIENAIFVGYNDFSLQPIAHLNKSAMIIAYCSIGFRSEKVVEKLMAANYTNVHNLYGGIFEWVNQGYKVKNATGFTDNVHTFNMVWSHWLLKGVKIY